MIVSNLFYTYDYSDKIYKCMNGHIFCIMEDKWVLEEPRYISPNEWCMILLKCNDIKHTMT